MNNTPPGLPKGEGPQDKKHTSIPSPLVRKEGVSSPLRRWTVLVIVAIVMMTGYIFWDVVSPLSTQLKAPTSMGGFGWTAAEYGFYAGSYSIFNIFLLMLFFGGIILDKCGIRFTGIMATGAMLLGAIINYYAITSISPDHTVDLAFTIFGFIPEHVKVQVLVSALGFGLFGMGCDITGITVSKIVTKWFTGHELASAMGIQVALARLGTASALSFSPLIAQTFGLSASILAGAIVLAIGFALFIAYVFMDKKYDRSTPSTSLPPQRGCDEAEEKFSFHDFLTVLRNPGFWLIALLCVSFYSSIRPFMKFATDLLVNKFSVAPTSAGWIVAVIPYGTIVLTPLFGVIYDRIGHGARLMLTGCIIITAAHLLLALPMENNSWFALVVMAFAGVAYSLVPSVMWPSVPKLVPLKQLGTAYSIIYYIQNLGLMLVPVWVGHVIDRNTDATTMHVDYTEPMLIFAALGMAAVIIAAALLLLDKKNGYGLEKANIKKAES